MIKEVKSEIIELGKSLNIENIIIELFLPSFPVIKGSESIFKINKANAYKYINKDVEFLIKGLHLIEELYKKETKNSFGFGSPSPTFKLIESYSKANFNKASELEYWIAKNGGNYYIKPIENNDFKSQLKINLNIRKAYHYYYAIIENIDLKRLLYSNGLFSNYMECIISNDTNFPSYLSQANSNVLSNKSGILITKDMFEQLIKKQPILNDFNTLYFYQLLNVINDKNRYDKIYSSHYEINKLNKTYKLEEQVYYENSEWKNILITNPDLFITRQSKHMIIASKDYKLLQNIKL